MKEQADEAFEHLQIAAHELIAAARAFLDLAEEVVEDPKAGEALIDTLSSLARRARSVVPRGEPDRDGDGGVEHIRVD